jgi:hypothetical protein
MRGFFYAIFIKGGCQMFNIGDLLRVSSNDHFNGAVGRVESLHPDCDPNEMVFMIKYDEPLKGRGMFPFSQLTAVNL